MRKVLFSFAGHRDPFGDSGSEGSVVTLVRHVQPDQVVLIAVNAVGKEFAEQSAEWLNLEEVMGLPRECIFIETIIGDPVDYAATLEIVHDTIFRHRERCLKQYVGQVLEFAVNASSGTPAMKASMILAKHMGLIGSGIVYQVRDPKFVDSKHPRVSEVNVGFLEEENFRREFLLSIETHEFARARELLNRLQTYTFSDAVRKSTDWLHYTLDGFEAWELGHFQKARDTLKKSQASMNQTSISTEMQEYVDSQVQWLSVSELMSTDETERNLFELYQSVCRYYRTRRYTDGLARFWRLVEGAIYWQLRVKYTVDARHLDVGNLPLPLLSRLKEQGLIRLRAARGRQDIFRLVDLLKDVSDEPFTRWLNTLMKDGGQRVTVGQQLHRLRSRRNESLAAHGMRPVSEEELHRAVIIARHLVACVLPHGAQLEAEYPFQPVRLTNMLRTYWTGVVTGDR